MPKKAIFRFYEELNDFLPKDKKKVSFEHSFSGKISVKDVIESFGVPHVEVDLIIVNGNSVNFSYKLENNDHVSVYPVFETLNIWGVQHLREKTLRDVKFILDVHLGKLARHLRKLGFDTLYRNDYDDHQIVNISLAEHRIILTRDIGLLKIKTVTHGYFIRNHDPNLQLYEVLKYFDLYDMINPFSRCINCNGELISVAKEQIEHLLKPLTRQHFNNFFMCSGCRNIYWEGSHYEKIKESVKKINHG